MAVGLTVGIAVLIGESRVAGTVGGAVDEEKGINVLVGCTIETSVDMEQPLSEVRAIMEIYNLRIFANSARIIPEGGR